MTRALALTVIALAFASATPSAHAQPPRGLSPYGRTIWNLDALLHDTFGAQRVYLANRGERTPRGFSTVEGADCCSHRYLFTFSTARRSAFRLLHPTQPPPPYIGAAGFDRPLTIHGAYISCGARRWLYEHGGNQPVNFWALCLRRGEQSILR